MDNKKIELLKAQFSAEFKPVLKEISDRELYEFYSTLSQFLHIYATGYELGRDIILVLDNNIVQDFKHQSIRRRGLRALAYRAFCRFVAHPGGRKAETHSSEDAGVCRSCGRDMH